MLVPVVGRVNDLPNPSGRFLGVNKVVVNLVAYGRGGSYQLGGCLRVVINEPVGSHVTASEQVPVAELLDADVGLFGVSRHPHDQHQWTCHRGLTATMH